MNVVEVLLRKSLEVDEFGSVDIFGDFYESSFSDAMWLKFVFSDRRVGRVIMEGNFNMFY